MTGKNQTIQPAAQLYTVRKFTKTPEAIEQTLRKVKAMGFDAIQISGFGPIRPERLASLVEELQLDACITHSAWDRMHNDLDALVAEHQLLHCDTIGLGSMPQKFHGSAEGFAAFLQDAGEVAKRIADKGLHFAYHNHAFEMERFSNGRLGIDMLIEDSDPETFGFILDTYWLQYGGVNPADYIRRVNGRMKVCHFKDYAIVHTDIEKQPLLARLCTKLGVFHPAAYTPAFAEVGCGNLDLEEAYRACRESGVQYIAIEQDTCPRDPFDCLRVSLENLKQIGARA